MLLILLIITVFAAGYCLGAVTGEPLRRRLAGLRRSKEPSPTPAAEEETGVPDAEAPAEPTAKAPTPRYGELTGEGGKLSAADSEFVERAIDYINANLRRAELSVEELSAHMGMSRVNLYKRLRVTTGRTPIELIRVLRLKRAAAMLAEGRLSVAEVAGRVGFNSPRIFSRYFKEEYGELPSDYTDRNSGL